VTVTSQERKENAYTLGVQAGLWGYPLAARVEAFPRTLEVKGIGRNSFQKFDRLKTAEDRFVVTPNNLTIDGYAILDVADGPVVIHVPKLADDRWFIVQVGDAFDDVVLNVGGSRPHVPGAYLITGPDFKGRVPGDMMQVSFRTNIGFVGLRIAVSGADDLPGATNHSMGRTHRGGKRGPGGPSNFGDGWPTRWPGQIRSSPVNGIGGPCTLCYRRWLSTPWSPESND
jgi:hypothetical protein